MEKPRLLPVTTVMFSLTFLAAITVVPWYGLVFGYEPFEWAVMAIILLFNGTAMTAGYHRLWSHRTYRAHWSLRLWFALWGAMAAQNSVLHWASGHRRHHRFVDDYHKDPYSASRGFWFSHIGWMLRPYDEEERHFSDIRDLQRDPIVMWQHRHYTSLALTANFGLPILIGWLYGDVVASFLLSGVLRLVLSHHCTFLINSLAHMWGSRPYTDRNTARDNSLLALLTWGEGYHNFHHIFQSDYRNGVRWWQYDPTKWVIFVASKVGLAWDLHRVSDFRIAKAQVDMEYKRAGQRLTCEKALMQLEEQYIAVVAALREWSILRQQELEARAKQLRKQWVSSEAHTRYIELKKTLRVQRDRWYLVLEGYQI